MVGGVAVTKVGLSRGGGRVEWGSWGDRAPAYGVNKRTKKSGGSCVFTCVYEGRIEGPGQVACWPVVLTAMQSKGGSCVLACVYEG